MTCRRDCAGPLLGYTDKDGCLAWVRTHAILRIRARDCPSGGTVLHTTGGEFLVCLESPEAVIRTLGALGLAVAAAGDAVSGVCDG